MPFELATRIYCVYLKWMYFAKHKYLTTPVNEGKTNVYVLVSTFQNSLLSCAPYNSKANLNYDM